MQQNIQYERCDLHFTSNGLGLDVSRAVRRRVRRVVEGSSISSMGECLLFLWCEYANAPTNRTHPFINAECTLYCK